MGKARGATALYNKLTALKGSGASAEARELIGQGLASQSSVVVEKAAAMAVEFRLADLCGQIGEAFTRFLRDPDFEDRGCGAKTALARAAVDLKCQSASLYLAGIRYSEMRPGDPPTDPAVEIRQLCALGLLQMRHPEVMNELVGLLVDPVPQARIGAVRALAHTGREDAALVLRLKVLQGDREPDVLAEAFLALVELAPEAQLDFVGGFLSSEHEQIHTGAALALGASRRPKAFDMLRDWFERNADGPQPTALLAIATCRIPAAIDYLLSLIKSAPFGADAITALALYRHDPALRARVLAAVQDCGSAIAKSAFDKHFGRDA